MRGPSLGDLRLLRPGGCFPRRSEAGRRRASFGCTLARCPVSVCVCVCEGACPCVCERECVLDWQGKWLTAPALPFLPLPVLTGVERRRMETSGAAGRPSTRAGGRLRARGGGARAGGAVFARPLTLPRTPSACST